MESDGLSWNPVGKELDLGTWGPLWILDSITFHFLSKILTLCLQPGPGFWICDSYSPLLSLKARQASGSWICDGSNERSPDRVRGGSDVRRSTTLVPPHVEHLDRHPIPPLGSGYSSPRVVLCATPPPRRPVHLSPLLSPLFSVFRAARGLEHSSTLNMSGKRPERPPKRSYAADADGHMLKAIRAAAGGGVELRPIATIADYTTRRIPRRANSTRSALRMARSA